MSTTENNTEKSDSPEVQDLPAFVTALADWHKAMALLVLEVRTKKSTAFNSILSH
jgi:hypothetical protein